MAKVKMLALLLASFISSAVLIDISKITVFPKHGSISGVFHASLPGSYAFNASTARDVCEQLGVTIADKAQVLRASTHGFETCRFGWIDEQIAVVPRIQANEVCGKGKVGVIPWRAGLSTKFDVFCFNSTDFEAQAQAATTQVHKTTSGTPTPHMSTGGVRLQRAKTTHSASSASSSDVQSTFPGSSRSLIYQEDEEKAQALGGTKPNIGVVPTALLITTIFTFLLAAMVAVWYFKMNRSCTGLWDGKEQKECIETEVWDECSTKGVKESRTEPENNPEDADDVSVTMNDETDSENESKSRATS
ncbi:lymphatic vessel endothelial hyaluronic acid receptor 1a [Colossoma macropomum]|uniref:lymphatic vessel endothelial hyaluronic acid receptor 1a n=1 Tax=Colossoma macropomum TaxID=42526 RepID=UPI001864CC0C|nr:lymphatic vessel endothelial hyaluronic acid receptor 1a [Colossoma macropomum]